MRYFVIFVTSLLVHFSYGQTVFSFKNNDFKFFGCYKLIQIMGVDRKDMAERVQIMEDLKSGKLINDFRTECHKEKPIRKGRANWRCPTCDADVTLDLVLLYDLRLREIEKKK